MKTVIEDPNDLCKFLRTIDVFVLVQGFRDVLFLDEKNVKVLISALKGKKKIVNRRIQPVTIRD